VQLLFLSKCLQYLGFFDTIWQFFYHFTSQLSTFAFYHPTLPVSLNNAFNNGKAGPKTIDRNLSLQSSILALISPLHALFILYIYRAKCFQDLQILIFNNSNVHVVWHYLKPKSNVCVELLWRTAIFLTISLLFLLKTKDDVNAEINRYWSVFSKGN